MAQLDRGTYETLFLLQPAPVLVITEYGDVVIANPAAQRLLGTRRGLRGSNLFELIGDAQEPVLRDAISEAISGREAAAARLAMPRLDATIRFARVEPNSTEQSLIAAFFDVDRSQIADRQPGAISELDEFVYSAAHDLKTPLRQITMGTMLIADTLPHDARARVDNYLRIIEQVSERANRLIDELSVHARMKVRPLVLKPVDLNRCLASVTFNLTNEINAANARIEQARLPTVHADPALTDQLFRGLLHNALTQRSPDRDLVVSVDGERTGRGAVITLRDNGRGFDADLAELQFKPFHSADADERARASSITRATCLTIAERHGWSLRCHGAPDRGASFEVTIPADHIVDVTADSRDASRN